MPRRRNHGAARTTGLVLAGGVALIFAGVIAGIVVSNRESPKDQPRPEGMEPPPDVKSTPGTSANPIAAGSSELLITLVDPLQPTRVQYEISAEKSEPMPDGRYRMTRPRAWYFLRDGRTLLIEAERGQATLPDPQRATRPENGLLEGEVVVRLFPKLDNGRRPAPTQDTPQFSIRTNVMRFDGLRSEVELPERFDVQHERFTFAGLGLTAYLSEQSQRLEFARIERALAPLTVLPAPKAPAPAARVAQAAPAGGTPAVPRHDADDSAWYDAAITGPVHLARGNSTLDALSVQAWFRTRAVAPVAAPISQFEGGIGFPTQPILQLAALPVAMAQPGTPAPASVMTGTSELPTTIEWTGPLVIRSVQAPPVHTGKNDSVVRFAGEDGAVRAADAEQKVHAKGDFLEYRPDSREVTLSGTASAPAEVTLDGSGTAQAVAMHADLTAGTARMYDGPGALIAAGETRRGVWWKNEADFEFALTPTGEFSHLTQAHVSGDAVARDADAMLLASAMHAKFTKGDSSSPVLTEIAGIGQVTGDDGKGGQVGGDSLTVAFAPPAAKSDPKPSHAVILGNARASRGDDSLTADRITAEFGPVPGAAWGATGLAAFDHVVYQGREGLRATADRLVADPIAQTSTLSGPQVAISSPQGTVRGTHINLDAEKRSATVVGEGRLERPLDATDSQPAGVAQATWTKSLTFDDLSGSAVVTGTAEAVMTRGATSKDTLKADEVHLQLTPGQKPAKDTPSPKRELLSARAVGTAGAPASIESRRYSDAATPVLERLLYLEGGQVIADLAQGTLDVPGAGKALALDRRASQQAPAAPLAATGQGTTLLRWADSLHVRRQDGTAVLSGGVRLTHERAGGARTDLESQSLTARFNEQPNPTADGQGIRGELLSATATGSVWMRSDAKEMRADTVEYDAKAESAEAWGSERSPVTAVDPARATPLTAQRMRWDIRTGRIEVLGAGPITTPR